MANADGPSPRASERTRYAQPLADVASPSLKTVGPSDRSGPLRRANGLDTVSTPQRWIYHSLCAHVEA